MKPLQSFSLLDTDNLDQARELVSRQFCRHKLEIRSDARSFHALHHVARGRLLSLNYIRYGTSVSIEPGELEHFYLIQIPLIGHATIHNGGSKVDSNCAMASVLNPDRYTRMRWSTDCEQILIYIDHQVFRRFAEIYTGRTLYSDLVFESALDCKRSCLANWRQRVMALVQAADEHRMFLENQPINQQLLEEQILSGLLEHQPSNLSAILEATSRSTIPGSVRAARDFIYANASQSVSMADISNAAGTPIRTLQHQFNRAGFDSPLKILRNERLARVYYELSSGHCKGTVTDVASRWGFVHLGRFSRYYYRRFGEVPSATLARGRKLKSHK